MFCSWQCIIKCRRTDSSYARMAQPICHPRAHFYRVRAFPTISVALWFIEPIIGVSFASFFDILLKCSSVWRILESTDRGSSISPWHTVNVIHHLETRHLLFSSVIILLYHSFSDRSGRLVISFDLPHKAHWCHSYPFSCSTISACILIYNILFSVRVFPLWYFKWFSFLHVFVLQFRGHCV